MNKPGAQKNNTNALKGAFSKSLTIRVNESELFDWKVAAQKSGMPLSDYIRAALKAFEVV